MKKILEALARRENLPTTEAKRAMELMITGQATDEQTKTLLLALRDKGATPEEIAGFAHVMRAHARPVTVKRTGLIDVCGTGGDGANTFNISTAVAFVLAGGGAAVAKHGNRSVSSRCGSADVLERLGLNPNQEADSVIQDLEETGLGFFFAPTFHPAVKRFAEVRRALKVRTIFNLLGPLTNPAKVKRQVMGIFDRTLLETMALTLRELGSDEALIVHGEDGLDELTLTGRSHVAHLKNGEVKTYDHSPSDAGLKTASLEALRGGTPAENAIILEAILRGEDQSARRDAVVYNAAAAFQISGLARDLKEGAERAAASIDSKAALNVLEKLRSRSPSK